MSSSCLVTSLYDSSGTQAPCEIGTHFLPCIWQLNLTLIIITSMPHSEYIWFWTYHYVHFDTTMHPEFGILGGQSVEIQVFLWTVSPPQGSWAQTFREWGDKKLQSSKTSHFLFLQAVWDLEMVLGLAVAILLGLWGLEMIAGFALLLSTIAK